MPGTTPPTSQLDWLSSTTAMIVLFWSRATRDLLKSFGWGIAALHRLMQRRSCHFLAARPLASSGSAQARTTLGVGVLRSTWAVLTLGRRDPDDAEPGPGAGAYASRRRCG